MALWDSHRSVLLFFAKLVAIYALWYVIYESWLLPDGRLDAWLSHQVVQAGGSLLSVLGLEGVSAQGRVLRLPETPGVKVVNGCNGLSTTGLFVGFVCAFPGRWARRLPFLAGGILVVFAANVVRVAGLLLLQRYWPPGFDFVHGLGAPTFFYLVVFGLWMLWARVGTPPAAARRAPTKAEAPADARSAPAAS